MINYNCLYVGLNFIDSTIGMLWSFVTLADTIGYVKQKIWIGFGFGKDSELISESEIE